MKRIKLLNFVSNYAVGLTQAMTEQTEELVKERSLDIFNISSENEQEEGLFKRLEACGARLDIVEGLEVHSNFRGLARQIAAIIDKYSISHVNVHTNWQLALVAYVKHLKKSKQKFRIIYTIHGYRHNSAVKSVVAIGIIGTALRLFADRVISMSTYVSKRFPMVKSKTDLVYYMMKGPQYEKPISPVEGHPLKMVFPAQFRHGKRQEILIDAVATYIKRTGDRTITLYLPGSGSLRETMIERAKSLGIENNVIFPGQMKLAEVGELYLKTNIALCSSNVETYGRCIAEPFMLGRCVITQKTGVAEDIIRNGENGMFFTDAESLAMILEDLNGHPEKVTAMSTKALDDRKIFSRDNVMKSYLTALANA